MPLGSRKTWFFHLSEFRPTNFSSAAGGESETVSLKPGVSSDSHVGAGIVGIVLQGRLISVNGKLLCPVNIAQSGLSL